MRRLAPSSPDGGLARRGTSLPSAARLVLPRLSGSVGIVRRLLDDGTWRGRLGVAGLALLAAILLAVGQTIGGTLAYFTDSQNVGSNTLGAAAQFAPSGASASPSGSNVTVSWTAVGFSVNGYNVYRSTISGGPYTKINGSVVTGTSYPDNSLAEGTYYYVVRLVNTRGVESATNSNEASATVDVTLPSSAITVPTSGQTINASSFTITGTAGDSLSGVSQVEVSTDGGNSWNAATGTTSWSYAWTTPSDGSYTIQSRARDVSGNVQSPVASITVTIDKGSPRVVPPTSPANNATAIATNSSITVTFSEAMNASTVESAFALKRCTDVNCTAFTTILTAPADGTITWEGAGQNILKFDPSASLATSTYYQISVTTTAQDPAGNALSAAFTSKFQTGTGTDTAAPTQPTITSPSVTTWTTDTTYTLTGDTNQADLLIKVYVDNAPTGTFGAEDTLLTSSQLAGGLQSFSIPVSLNAGTANRFLVTATDLAGNQSTAAFAPVIYQGDNRMNPGTVVAAGGSSTILVQAPYNGDADNDGAANVRWKLFTSGSYSSPCPGGTGCPVAMTRANGQFTYTITGLAASTSYDVQVTYSDPDGIGTGVVIQAVTVSTTAGTLSGLITSVTDSPDPFPSRAAQGTTITVNTSGAQGVQVRILTATNKVSGCITPSNGVSTYVWDGTDGSLTPAAQADGNYNFQVAAYSDVLCSTSSEVRGFTATISNARDMAMSPAPATMTLTTGQSACVTATALNRLGSPVPNGAPITFSYSASPSGGAYTLTQPSTGQIGGAAAGCSAPPANSGQAVAKITVNTATPSTITVTATMNTQLSGTTLTTVNGATTINDPPDAPSDVELSPGSIIVRFKPASRPTVAGYYVRIGTEPGRYTRTVDIGHRTHAHIEDGIVPGQRYYVAVQAYDKLGQTSPPSKEGSLVAPPHTLPASISVTETSPVPAAAQRDSSTPGTKTPTSGTKTIRARVLDRDGRPAGGAVVAFSAPRGVTIDPASGTANVDGVVTTRMTVTDPSLTTTRVEAVSGPARGARTVNLLTRLPAGRYEDDHPAIRYSGEWTVRSATRASGGEQHISGEREAAVEVAFQGRSVSVIFSCGPNLGPLRVLLDDRPIRTVDQRADAACWQQKVSLDAATTGAHRLRLEPASNRPVTVDALIVSGEPPATPTATPSATPRTEPTRPPRQASPSPTTTPAPAPTTATPTPTATPTGRSTGRVTPTPTRTARSP